MAASDAVEISYQQWGADFFREAVTAQRILGAVDGLAGKPIDFGPIGVGPGRVAKVTARGAIGQATARDVSDAQVTFVVTLPVDLVFELDLGVDKHTFRAAMEIPLKLTALALEGLRIHVDVAAPQAADVAVRLKADGLRASLMQKVVPIESELKRFVSKYVAKEVERPEIRDARTIDVASKIDRAYGAPAKAEKPVADDLNDELARDMEESFLAEGL